MAWEGTSMKPLCLLRSSVTAAGVLLATSIALPTAGHAIIFDLTSDHCTGGCGPAGTVFGTVTLTQVGTAVDVTVHTNDPFGYAKTGAADDQAFKFNATGV